MDTRQAAVKAGLTIRAIQIRCKNAKKNKPVYMQGLGYVIIIKKSKSWEIIEC
jgi:hypothetical protein